MAESFVAAQLEEQLASCIREATKWQSFFLVFCFL